MTDVFISYAKADNKSDAITNIVRALSQTNSPLDREKSIEVWFDEDGIRTGEDWSDEIDIGLQNANTVAIFISPRYFASYVCNRELETALNFSKKIIPIWVEPIYQPETDIATAINERAKQGNRTATEERASKNYQLIEDKQAIRWDSDTSDNKHQTIQQLISAIFENAKLDDDATRWLDRYLSKTNGTGDWLSGADLKQAQVWLKKASQTPNYTIQPDVQEFIDKSQTAQRRRQGTYGLVAAVSLAIIGIVSFVAYFQSNSSQTNEAERIAASADSIIESEAGDRELAAMLAIASVQLRETPAGRATLETAAQNLWISNSFTLPPEQVGERATALSIAPDGEHVLLNGAYVSLSEESVIRTFIEPSYFIASSDISPDGRYAAFVTSNARMWQSPPDGEELIRNTSVWDIETGEQIHEWNYFSFNTDVKFSGDSSRLFLGHERQDSSEPSGNVARIMNLNTGEEIIAVYDTTMGPGSFIATMTNNARFLATTHGDVITLWDATTGEAINEFPAPTNYVVDMTSGIEGRWISAVGNMGPIHSFIYYEDSGWEPWLNTTTGLVPTGSMVDLGMGSATVVGTLSSTTGDSETAVIRGLDYNTFGNNGSPYRYTYQVTNLNAWDRVPIHGVVFVSNTTQINVIERDTLSLPDNTDALIRYTCSRIYRELTIEERDLYELDPSLPICDSYS
ncbi:MAG: TIR domain-containing protein [Chloroflexota bacterium]